MSVIQKLKIKIRETKNQYRLLHGKYLYTKKVQLGTSSNKY